MSVLIDLSRIATVYDRPHVTAPPEDFSSKNLSTIKSSLCWYLSFFAVLNALLRSTLPEAFLLGKSLTSP